MSKSSAAKKARRKRRVASRNDSWLPSDVHDQVRGVRRIADVILARGWEFDDEFSADDFLTWYYPPSAIEVDEADEVTEPVTRIWLTDVEEPHVILVGAGQTDKALSVEDFLAALDELEAYRAGDPVPEALG